MRLSSGKTGRLACVALLYAPLILPVDKSYSVETLTLFGTNNVAIEANPAVTTLSYSQGATSTTVSIAFGGTFGGIFMPAPFDWSNVTDFGLLMSVPGLNPSQSFTIDFFNSRIFDADPTDYYVSRFLGTTAGVSQTLSILALTKDNSFVPEGGAGGLNNLSNVAGVQFTWNNQTASGTSTNATLGGFVGLTGPVNPVVTSTSYSSNAFTMTWSGTGFLPVTVQRRGSLESGQWTAIAQGVTMGQYTDADPPVGRAFYRLVLP